MLIAKRSLQARCGSGGRGGPVLQPAARPDQEFDITTASSIIHARAEQLHRAVPEQFSGCPPDRLALLFAQAHQDTSWAIAGRASHQGEREAAIHMRLMTLKFGPPAESGRVRIRAAGADMLLERSARMLSGERVEDVFA